MHFEIDEAVLHLEKYAQVFELGFRGEIEKVELVLCEVLVELELGPPLFSLDEECVCLLVFLASLLELLHLIGAEVRSDNLSEYFRALQVVFDAFFFELVDIRLGVAADEGNSGGDEVSRFSQLSEHFLFINI